MDKISFHAKKTKFVKFKADFHETISKQAEEIPLPSPSKKIENSETTKAFKNKNEVFADLSDRLINHYNIDDISVYQLLGGKNGRLYFENIFGAEIGKLNAEKYFGYDCPMICTNAEGMTDDRSHRARFIERFGNYVIVVSSNAYEAYRISSELSEIRKIISIAFAEVKKL